MDIDFIDTDLTFCFVFFLSFKGIKKYLIKFKGIVKQLGIVVFRNYNHGDYFHLYINLQLVC